MPFGDPLNHAQIGGEDYEFSEMTVSDHDAIQAYLARLPNPGVPRQDFSGITSAVFDGLDLSQFDHLPNAADIRTAHLARAVEAARRAVEGQLREARAEAQVWPPIFGEPEGTNALMAIPGGKAQILWVALRRRRPGMKLKDAEALLDRMTLGDFMRVMQAFTGGAPAAADAGPGDDAGPKAPPAPGIGGPPPTSGTPTSD